MANATPSTVAANICTPWTPADYHLQDTVEKGAAWKLADSGIAPLVAQARGYEHIHDTASMTAHLEQQRNIAGNLSLKKSLNGMLAGGMDDVLGMPWVQVSDVRERGVNARITTTQYRPSTPVATKDGKRAKYTWNVGSTMVLDVHPATPASWLGTASNSVLVAEGLLKADSALTAMLMDALPGRDDLGRVDTQAEARQKLHDLMESIPAQLRVPVIATASVSTWDQPAQWDNIELRGKRVLLSFDGDLATNPNVWQQTDKASRMLSRRSKRPVTLLKTWDSNVELAAIAAGFLPTEKIGIDDYLTRIGNWSDLLDLATPDLPPQPHKETAITVGGWRVNPENKSIVEELVHTVAPDGSRTGTHWETRSHLSFEVLEARSTRLPTQEETRTGVIADSVDVPSVDELIVRFHVLSVYQEADDVPSTFDVRMPSSALAASRDSDWASLIRSGAMKLPSDVLLHPHYPPADMKRWLAACKLASRYSDTNGWARMGWVPTGSGCAFIAGSTVIAGTEEQERVTTPGLTASVLPRVSAWGVSDNYRDVSRREWLEGFTDTVRTAVDVWFKAFKDQRIAAIGFALMLQPTLPVRGAGTVCMLTGPAGSGKSFFASLILAGWGAYPTAWTHKSLPGTASDTLASTEETLSQTPLHVMDDLAPNSDAGRGAAKMSAVEDMIRGVFNGTPRTRKGDAPIPPALAHLIVTAENAPIIESIRQRTWEISLAASGLLVDGGRERLERARAKGVFTRLTGGLVRAWALGLLSRGSTSWEDVVYSNEVLMDVAAEYVTDHATEMCVDLNKASRQVEKAVALNTAIYALSVAFDAAVTELRNDADEADRQVIQFLDEEVSGLLTQHAMAAHAEHAKHTPGRLALRSIAMLLQTGRAHLSNPVDPGKPVAGEDAEKLASGWRYTANGWVQQGPEVGVVGVTAKGERLVLLNGSAFTVAKTAYPELIPSGSTAKAAWVSLSGETELVPDGVAKSKNVRLQGRETAAFGIGVKWDGLMSLLGTTPAIDGDQDAFA